MTFLCCVTVMAQEKCHVSGIVTDKANNTPIQGVNVTCTINGKHYGIVTDETGHYTISLMRGCNTVLYFTHLNYKKVSKVVNCQDKRQTINVEMTSNITLLNEVVISQELPTISQRGDTTVYYANAFKVNEDATAFDLISQKLPAVGIRDGKLEAHGEEVKEIRIDGREFFKNDINMALKNLPANIIEEIQIYNQISDYSLLTGFDDGDTRKTINIKTKNGFSKSLFGKGTTGYGVEDKYKLYGMSNLFRDDVRLSVFAQMNNVNEQNFSMLDLLSATGSFSGNAPAQTPYSKGNSDNSFHPATSDDISSMLVSVNEYGVTTSKAFGTNYSDEWFGNRMKFSGHYLFNKSENNTEYEIFDEYFGNTASDNLQSQKLSNDNTNHRFNAKYEYRITPQDYLLIRPTVSYQKKTELSDLVDWTVKPNDTVLLLNQNTLSDQYVTGTSAELMYVHRFGDGTHSVAADTRVSHIYTKEDISMDFSNAQTLDEALQNTMCKNTMNTCAFVLAYIYRPTDNSQLKLDLGWKENYGVFRRGTEIKRGGIDVYQVDSLLSGSTWNEYGGMQTNLSYMLSLGSMNLVAGTEFLYYDTNTSNDRFNIKRKYKTLLPYAFMRYSFGNSQLHIRYKASQNFPGLQQLHDAINNSNAIMAIRGNMKLKPEMRHNLMARFIAPMKNSSIFVFFANVEQADDYISTMRSLSSESFAENGERRNTEIRSYKNCDGYFSCSSLLAYGFPCKFLSSNVNVSSLVKYMELPGFWDNNKVFNEQWNWSGSVTIGSNISANVDFVIDCNAKYTESRNITYKNVDVAFWSLSYGGQLNWHIIPSVKIMLECGNTNYIGSGTSKYNALIGNASLSYKFLKDRKGELSISIHDIFDQDNSFYQTTTEMYKRAVTANVLGQYAMLTFTYNLTSTPKTIDK